MPSLFSDFISIFLGTILHTLKTLLRSVVNVIKLFNVGNISVIISPKHFEPSHWLISSCIVVYASSMPFLKDIDHIKMLFNTLLHLLLFCVHFKFMGEIPRSRFPTGKSFITLSTVLSHRKSNSFSPTCQNEVARSDRLS